MPQFPDPNNPEVYTVVDGDKVADIQVIGAKHGLSVDVVAREGESYLTGPGTTVYVSTGKVLVRIYTQWRDLTRFWENVRDLNEKKEE